MDWLRVCAIGSIHLGTRVDLEARLPHVGHDTHDATLVAAADHDDRASEWVVAAKEHARRRVAEDDDGFRSFTIIVSEIPAAPEGDRQRPVVTGGDGLEAHDHVVVDRLAWRPQRIDTQIHAQGNARCRGSIDHARQPPRAIDDVGIGRAEIGRRRSGTRARKNIRRQHAVAPEAGIDSHHVDEAADEERRANEEHDGQRDLGDDQRRTGADAASARAAATGALGERG